MCLALPGQLTAIREPSAGGNPQGEVSYSGVIKTVDLSFVPEAQVGEYLIVHAGFALSVLDQEEAQQTLALFAELRELGE